MHARERGRGVSERHLVLCMCLYIYKRLEAEKANDKSSVTSRERERETGEKAVRQMLLRLLCHTVVAIAVVRRRSQSIKVATILLLVNMLIKVHLTDNKIVF